ncbi:MAG: hypothetical protein H6881_00445 [Rhodobiaceae bacterium]|nr:hypothetical protein [Hyphomonas sp.]MCC0050319.1 hypothetical protein [Rhodobiaceae bacterium]
MSTHGALRSYELVLDGVPGSVRSAVRASGPDNALSVTSGRRWQDVVRIPGLIFAVCPRAHTAAGLGAIEAAAGIKLPDGQGAARGAVVLAESVAQCIWRQALVWPGLIGETEMPAKVRNARQASDALAAAIFPGGWLTPGGAPIDFNHDAATQAFYALAECFDGLSDVAARVVDAANEVSGGHVFDPLPALASEIGNAGALPVRDRREETPRSLAEFRTEPVRLGDWFAAQADHAGMLLARLELAVSRIRPAAPVNTPSGISGSGIGVSMTARGRLRHVIALEEDIVTSWQASAPTDWNFAPGGPLDHYARSLDPARLEEQGRWLVAALDPCAPCSIAAGEVRADA